ncbi:hypothetical protein M408DRAFT_9370 [Serendipita vermifera MAFF 305830]|uniref:Uncharacterized protein n=1 Tax=Serendipita vermifera MAFF 305830 TaxID=933852 RepID=A0A0C2XEA0_SERVB|nr:hypothetical protein M408DRAFT_9370 [Serendipita vermifera MAFF 305830]
MYWPREDEEVAQVDYTCQLEYATVKFVIGKLPKSLEPLANLYRLIGNVCFIAQQHLGHTDPDELPEYWRGSEDGAKWAKMVLKSFTESEAVILNDYCRNCFQPLTDAGKTYDATAVLKHGEDCSLDRKYFFSSAMLLLKASPTLARFLGFEDQDIPPTVAYAVLVSRNKHFPILNLSLLVIITYFLDPTTAHAPSIPPSMLLSFSLNRDNKLVLPPISPRPLDLQFLMEKEDSAFSAVHSVVLSKYESMPASKTSKEVFEFDDGSSQSISIEWRRSSPPPRSTSAWAGPASRARFRVVSEMIKNMSPENIVPAVKNVVKTILSIGLHKGDFER